MKNPLYIAFVWHMHQPYYRDPFSSKCPMPWVRLHASKDYVDMVKRLEAFPNIHQTFNIVPSLLDQVQEYLPPEQATDTFLEHSRVPATELSREQALFILRWFFMGHVERMIDPYPRYQELWHKRGQPQTHSDWKALLEQFDTQELLDTQVWFNLAWIDPWLRAQDPQLAQMEQKGRNFTEQDKAKVLAAQQQFLADFMPTYQSAAAKGSIELTTSPYYHPIMPLLCDPKSARTAMPDVTLPSPLMDAQDDARWQIEMALSRHQEAFNQRPVGMWPPEGSVSEPFVQIAAQAGIRWIATDEAILWRTLKQAPDPNLLYQPHQIERSYGDITIVFRDRTISNLIGFTYSRMDPQEAITDFLGRLISIHEQSHGKPRLVTILMDGENAWEFYPKDGHAFLTGLYQALNSDNRFQCVTISEFLNAHPNVRSPSLPELFPGSWIDANFATWIGHPEKNDAWSYLAQAKKELAKQLKDPEQSALRRSFGIAEGSDWMWWFGDTHETQQRAEFDQLFRTHLANCYRYAGQAIPERLLKPIRR